MSQNNICTYEELKDATCDFKDLTIGNFAKFIEVKTNNQFNIFDSKLLCELVETLSNNITSQNILINFLQKDSNATFNVLEKCKSAYNELFNKQIAMMEFENDQISKH